MKDCIRTIRVLGQDLNRPSCRQDQQFKVAALGLTFYLLHYWQSLIISCAHDQSLALPRYFLLQRKRGMSELLPKSLRALLLALDDIAPVDHHVMLLYDATDFDRANDSFSKRIPTSEMDPFT